MEAIYKSGNRRPCWLAWTGIRWSPICPHSSEADRQLVRDLSDRDPEQAFISVPYDMGRFFSRLDGASGRPRGAGCVFCDSILTSLRFDVHHDRSFSRVSPDTSWLTLTRSH